MSVRAVALIDEGEVEWANTVGRKVGEETWVVGYRALSEDDVERLARRVVELIAERWPEAAEDGAA